MIARLIHLQEKALRVNLARVAIKEIIVLVGHMFCAMQPVAAWRKMLAS